MRKSKSVSNIQYSSAGLSELDSFTSSSDEGNQQEKCCCMNRSKKHYQNSAVNHNKNIRKSSRKSSIRSMTSLSDLSIVESNSNFHVKTGLSTSTQLSLRYKQKLKLGFDYWLKFCEMISVLFYRYHFSEINWDCWH